MPITIRREENTIHRLTLSGTSRKADFDAAIASLLQQIGTGGTARLLVVLDEFDGWSQTDAWNLDFYIAHGDQIERIAIVGDPRWRHEALLFALADLRKAPVEFFEPGAMDRARAWLTDSPTGKP
jgi:hypothetical protein